MRYETWTNIEAIAGKQASRWGAEESTHVSWIGGRQLDVESQPAIRRAAGGTMQAFLVDTGRQRQPGSFLGRDERESATSAVVHVTRFRCPAKRHRRTFTAVNVVFHPRRAATRKTNPRNVPDKASCPANGDGWYYVQQRRARTRSILCGDQPCGAVFGGRDWVSVDISLGCATVIL